jgi:hypothetical protein
MRIVRLSNYFAGAREDWCDRAADMWPNAGEREGLRTKCKSTPMGFLTFDPWTGVGKAQRGLPANFSTDASMVAAGAAGAVIKIGTEGVNVVSPVVAPQPPATVPAQPNVPPAEPNIWTGALPGWTPKAARSNMPLILGAVGLGALALFVMRKRRSAPALAGYGKRRRSRRRSRR